MTSTPNYDKAVEAAAEALHKSASPAFALVLARFAVEAAAPHIRQPLLQQIAQLVRRAERAEAEVERLKVGQRVIEVAMAEDLTAERALADELAEALQDYMDSDKWHAALAKYEEARHETH